MKYHKYNQKIQKTDKLSTFNFDIFISYYFNIYTLQFLFANGNGLRPVIKIKALH